MIVYHAYHVDKPSFYIGQTRNALSHRRSQHINSANNHRDNSAFHAAIRKYGHEKFEWKILEECESEADMNNAEIRWVKLLRDCGHHIYNIADGGKGHSCESYWKTHPIAEETKMKISESLKKYYKNNQQSMKGVRGKDHPSFGKKHTEASKKKLSESKMGHIVTKETREKLRQANLGKKLQLHVIDMLRDKFSGRNNPSATPIICTTTGEYFDYAKLAATKYNLDLSSIIKVCKHKLKQTKGLVFEYQDPRRMATN